MIYDKKTGCLKDWLVEVSEESDMNSDVITARSLLSFRKCRNLFYLYQTIRTGTARNYDQFLCSRVHGFPVMGEYIIILLWKKQSKSMKVFRQNALHGIKGIGFDLQDGDEDYSGEYGLIIGDRIDRDLIDMIPRYKESPLVQKAINDMEKYLNEKHGKVQEAEQTVK